MKMINSFLLTLPLILPIGHIQENYRQVSLFHGKINLQVPDDWIRKDDYATFSNYEIAYSSRFSNKDVSSLITLNVYDKLYAKKSSVTSDRIAVERESDSLRWKRVKFIETGVKLVGKDDIGYLKYLFMLHHTKHYMIQCFFRDDDGFFYQIEIYSTRLSADDFQKIADTIFNSLSFNWK
jgi:hypothetical protein